MAQYTIKQTKSLSPVSYNEIEARVIQEDGKVYLVKQDEEGNWKTVLEKIAIMSKVQKYLISET